MRVTPGVLNWSYHRLFKYRWAGTASDYIERVASLRERFGLESMGIDLGVGGPQNQLPSRDPSTVDAVRASLEARRLAPAAVITPLEVHPDPDVVDRSLREAIGDLEVAADLGCRVATYGCLLHGRLTREGWLNVYARALGRLAEAGARCGLWVGQEDYVHFSSDDFSALLEAVGHPHAGIVNDVGNWLLLGEEPLPATDKLLERTIHVHLKDYVLDGGVWRSVPLGRGCVDLPSLIARFREAKPAAGDRLMLSVEVDLDGGDEHEALIESFEYLLALLSQDMAVAEEGQR